MDVAQAQALPAEMKAEMHKLLQTIVDVCMGERARDDVVSTLNEVVPMVVPTPPFPAWTPNCTTKLYGIGQGGWQATQYRFACWPNP